MKSLCVLAFYLLTASTLVHGRVFPRPDAGSRLIARFMPRPGGGAGSGGGRSNAPRPIHIGGGDPSRPRPALDPPPGSADLGSPHYDEVVRRAPGYEYPQAEERPASEVALIQEAPEGPFDVSWMASGFAASTHDTGSIHPPPAHGGPTTVDYYRSRGEQVNSENSARLRRERRRAGRVGNRRPGAGNEAPDSFLTRSRLNGIPGNVYPLSYEETMQGNVGNSAVDYSLAQNHPDSYAGPIQFSDGRGGYAQAPPTLDYGGLPPTYGGEYPLSNFDYPYAANFPGDTSDYNVGSPYEESEQTYPLDPPNDDEDYFLSHIPPGYQGYPPDVFGNQGNPPQRHRRHRRSNPLASITGDVNSANATSSDHSTQFQQYLLAYIYASSAISDTLFPVLDKLLDGTNSSLAYNMAFSLYADLTGAPIKVTSPFSYGRNCIGWIEDTWRNQTMNGTMITIPSNGTHHSGGNNLTTIQSPDIPMLEWLLTAYTLLPVYEEIWANMTQKSNATQYIKDLATLSRYLSPTDKSVVTANFNQTAKFTAKDMSYFLVTNQTVKAGSRR